MPQQYFVLGFSNFGGVRQRCILKVEDEEERAPSFYFGTFKPETATYLIEKFRVLTVKFEDTEEDASQLPIKIYPFRERIYQPGCEINVVNRKSRFIGFLSEEVCRSFQVEKIENGTLREWYDNGCLRKTTQFANGKRNGETRRYDIFENLTSVENYRNGRMDGICLYYTEGRLYQSKCYRGGFAHGPEKTYSNGSLFFSGEYSNGKPHGYFKSFDNYGIVTKQMYYNRGVQQIQP